MSSRKNLADYYASLREGDSRDTLEGLGEAADLAERLAEVDVAGKSDDEIAAAANAVHKLQRREEWTAGEADAFEAIVLPFERPVVDIRGGSFGAIGGSFAYLGAGSTRSRLESVIPSVGRIGLPDQPHIPFAGTGFVVGDDLLMTNRHVANLFAQGLGVDELVFLDGQSADVDFGQEVGAREARSFSIERVVMIHPYWDMALLAVRGLGVPALEFLPQEPRELVGRDVVVIGYPAFDGRNDPDLQLRIFRNTFNVKRLQPGRLRARADVRSFGRVVSAAIHDSTTLGGNSGSAVIDVATGRVVGLHFAGRYRVANYAVPAVELARDRRVQDAGIDFGDFAPHNATGWDSAWQRADAKSSERTRTTAAAEPRVVSTGPAVFEPGATVTWTLPLQVSVRLADIVPDGQGLTAGSQPHSGPMTEKMVEPFHDEDYAGRKGYAECFLGASVPLPRVTDSSVVSELDSGSHVIPYEHFSLVVHKRRRMALFTACNVDGCPSRREPAEGKKYTRAALTGLRKNDREKWFTDPRIPALHQLPDKFFRKDRKVFDKGHLVRRDAVAWGASYDELRRANGDSYHATNCSPQVKGFNRSNLQGLWGKLENLVLKQAEREGERCSVFSGPVFRDDDPHFAGFDDEGRIVVQIPRKYWKVVVTAVGSELRTFAFLLEQSLDDVDFGTVETFEPEAEWRGRMVSVAELERELVLVEFPRELHDSDQIDADAGESVRLAAR